MMTKVIFPDSFDFGMPPATLIGVGSRGLDRTVLEKRASGGMFAGLDFERRADHSYMHLISLGSMEMYGSNNNGDYFNKEAVEHECAAPGKGCLRVVALDGGLKKYHPTFEKTAAVYKNHVNSMKGGKPSGYIVKQAYNEEMERGELLVGLQEDKWRGELEKLANDKPVYFSMAANVPTDMCSYCHNRASRREDYCSHLKEAMCTLTKEGHRIGAINDSPMFHDISGVVIPADKIAFGLMKVASARVMGGAELAEMCGLVKTIPSFLAIGKSAAQRKSAALGKLSRMEKRFLSSAEGEDAVLDAFRPCCGCPDELSDDDMCNLFKTKSSGLFKELSSAGVVLPFKVFIRLVAAASREEIEPFEDEAQSMLPGMLSEVCDDPGLSSEVLDDSSYDGDACRSGGLARVVASALAPMFSALPGVVSRRLASNPIAGMGRPSGVGVIFIQKRASLQTSPEARYLALEYVKYVVSAVADMPEAAVSLAAARTAAYI